MGYLVLARKWRPKTFEEVVGQEHVTTTLANAIKAERVAHAYLFAGPRGVGKTTTARILARALNCASGPTPKPCGKCDPCKSISVGSNLDVLEIDGASNRGIDDVRELREQVRYAPSEGRYKVYIIDEVHMLTDQAFNALLKTLEEPPAHVVFVFATTSPQKIPLTILSRCQRFDFNLIPAQRILQRLKSITKKERFEIDEGGLALIARKARGSLRDAESLLDQVTSAAEGALDEESVTELLGIGGSELYSTLCDHINKSDASSALKDADSALRAGLDVGEFMSGLIEHLRALFLLSVDSGLESALDVPSSELPRYREQAELFKQKELLRLLEIASEAAGVMRRSEDPRFHAEVALARMAEVGTEEGLGDILRRLEELEGRLAAGAGASGAGPGEGENAPKSAGKRKTTPTAKTSTARKPAQRSAGAGPEGADVQTCDSDERAEAQGYESGVVEGAGRSASAGDTAECAVGATGVEAARTGPGFDQSAKGGSPTLDVRARGPEPRMAQDMSEGSPEPPKPEPASAQAMAGQGLAGQGLADERAEPRPAQLPSEPVSSQGAQAAASERAAGPMEPMRNPDGEAKLQQGAGAHQEPTRGAGAEPEMTATDASPQPHVESIPQAQLEELWGEVVKRVTAKKTYLGNFLTVATPVEARGGDLALAFPEAFSFHRDKVSENTNKRLIQEAMEGVFGEFLRLRCLTVSDKTSVKTSGQASASGSARSWVPDAGTPPETPPDILQATDRRFVGPVPELPSALDQQVVGPSPEGPGVMNQQATGPPSQGPGNWDGQAMGPSPEGLGVMNQQATGPPSQGPGTWDGRAVGPLPEGGYARGENHHIIDPRRAGGPAGGALDDPSGVSAAPASNIVTKQGATVSPDRGPIDASKGGYQGHTQAAWSGDPGLRKVAPAAEGLDEGVRRVLELFGGEVLKD